MSEDASATAESGESSRRQRPQVNRLVEVVRLIFIALFGTAGFEISQQFGSETTNRTLLAVFLGAAVGYVIGGAFGRLTVSTVTSVEQEFRKRPAAEIAVGVAGLVLGLVIAFLITFPLLILDVPPLVVWTSVIFIYSVMGSVGFRVARAKSVEIYAVLGLKPQARGVATGEINVIDTSVLIDGRILDLVDTGFMTGSLLIHSGVLIELQRIADSSDDNRRKRGRRGLDVLTKLQKDPRADVSLVEEDDVTDVDAALVRLAKDRGGTLVTADHNLAKVAEALNVPVRSINALASAFRVPLSPGEELGVKLTKQGREHGQGIGYMDDGTMVVVEDAVAFLGDDVTVTVTNTLQTSTGRMVFATLASAK